MKSRDRPWHQHAARLKVHFLLIGSCSQHHYTCMGEFQVERTKHLGHVTFGRVSDRTIRISWYEHNFICRVLILIMTLYQFPKSGFLASLGIISLSDLLNASMSLSMLLNIPYCKLSETTLQNVCFSMNTYITCTKFSVQSFHCSVSKYENSLFLLYLPECGLKYAKIHFHASKWAHLIKW